jgi:hypothetical protein
MFVCSRCAATLVEGARTCRCGGEGVLLLPPGQRDEDHGDVEGTVKRLRGRDVGAILGACVGEQVLPAMVEISTMAGYMIGRALEGKKLLAFSPLPPEPPRVDFFRIGGGAASRKRKGRRGKGRRRRKSA